MFKFNKSTIIQINQDVESWKPKNLIGHYSHFDKDHFAFCFLHFCKFGETFM